MAQWHRSNSANVGLRLLGLILCGIAYLAFSRLFASYGSAAHAHADAAAFVLAAAGFLSASAGSVCACLGHHLFDEIEISARWRRGGGDAASVRGEFLRSRR